MDCGDVLDCLFLDVYEQFTLISQFILAIVRRGIRLIVLVTLECKECGRRNYSTKKNKRNTTERIELKKYCKWCKEHTVHKETK